jgi:D-amino-acid dehydrogenase
MRIVVLGAGIVGASTAFHLTQLDAEVFLIDRDALGRATFAGAGIICPWLSQTRHRRYEEISFAAAKYYPELVAKLAATGENETGYEVVGGLIVDQSEGSLSVFVERLDELLARGVKEIGTVQLLGLGGPKELFEFRESYVA